ncbi:MAG: ABC transporter ATP-binding protein [Lachnospiraceae bacterium]|jgi:ABC-2 type transport system ATP-binding protein|nr:ABC transporter ATP-binding protein [Lachnospiraceae bacterium]
MADAIKTTALTKYYGKARGIIDLELKVTQGDFFGFIGPNGAGKSTTIRTLLGLLSPTGGRAEIFGKNILTHKEEILADTGYMPSEASFYRNRKVREIISLSASLRGTDRAQDCAAEAARLCERLELDTEKKICQLSLGNRKKVSVVCALQHKPRLCILDEPTSGLDPLMQREFFEILKERNREGATIFLSSHVLSEVQRHCRHAAVIREGRLLASDRIENLGYTGAKQVTVRGLAKPPLLKNIRDVKQNGDAMTFLYSGSPNALLETLAPLPLTDITIAEPDLEEIFLHYYTPQDSQKEDL